MQNRQAGFTITELIVTIVIMAMSVPVIVGLINLLGAINDRARDLATIHALVENKIEGLRSISFTGLSAGTTDFSSELVDTIASPRSASYTISSVNTALKQVDVTVTYNDHGSSKSLHYRTYVGELGVGQY